MVYPFVLNNPHLIQHAAWPENNQGNEMQRLISPPESARPKKVNCIVRNTGENQNSITETYE
jgi:hypothetical protein